MVGVLLLVDVDGQPLPQVLPPAALLVLGPRDGFSVGAAERRETRGDSEVPQCWVMGLGLGRTVADLSGNKASADTMGRDLGSGFLFACVKGRFIVLAFGLSLPRKCVVGDSRKVKCIYGDSAVVLSPPGSARAGYAAKLEARACSIVAVCRSA